MLTHVTGLDHLVVPVHDLDAAAVAWTKAGFTVSPRGRHSAEMQTANHTIMLDDNTYIELLAIERDAPANEVWRRMLDRREGLAGVALKTSDAEALAADLGGREVRRFGRPVALPDGSAAEARFSIVHLDDAAMPDLRLFGCQHHTPELVWQPGLMKHENRAKAIRSIEIVDPDPRDVADQLGALLRVEPKAMVHGLRIELVTGGTYIDLLSPSGFSQRHPKAPVLTGPATIRLQGRGTEQVASNTVLCFSDD
jgi:hypothetical protein